MHFIVPHIIVPNPTPGLSKLASDGYNITQDQHVAIVSKDIDLSKNLNGEALDAKTFEVRRSLEDLDQRLRGYRDTKAHVLIRKEARARMQEDQPVGYLAELTSHGMLLHNVATMDDFPLLAGYGSLIFPDELISQPELAKQNAISHKVSYVMINGQKLVFNRAPTAPRYGATQNERNAWAVLNTVAENGATSFAAIFDPTELAVDPRVYLARKNIDEIGFAKRLISPEDIVFLNGSRPIEQGVWILNAPLVTDADGPLRHTITTQNSRVSQRYIRMLASGLAGANQFVTGFAAAYLQNTFLPDGRPLGTLEDASLLSALTLAR